MTAEEKAEELKTDRKLQINDDKDTLISFSSTVKSANRPQTHPVKFKYKYELETIFFEAFYRGLVSKLTLKVL